MGAVAKPNHHSEVACWMRSFSARLSSSENKGIGLRSRDAKSLKLRPSRSSVSVRAFPFLDSLVPTFRFQVLSLMFSESLSVAVLRTPASSAGALGRLDCLCGLAK